MKKTNHILRLGEIGWLDLLFHLLKNCWAAILIALAAALTVWSVSGASLPESYSESVTISVYETTTAEQWSDQLRILRTKALNLTNAINAGSVSTDFASAALNRKIDAAVRATLADPTNLITLTVTSPTPEETYLYLTALIDNLDTVAAKAGLTNISVRAVTTPVMPDATPDPWSNAFAAIVAALAAGVLACAVLVIIPILEGRIATRKAAERLSLLPIAGALNRGGKGRGLNAVLPLVNGEQTDGSYADRLNEAAAYLLAQDGRASTKIRVRALIGSSDTKNKKKTEKAVRSADRIALNLALAMSDAGAKVCLIDERGEAFTTLGIAEKSAMRHTLNSRLTLSRLPLDDAQASEYDRVITASDEDADGGLLLWTLEAGSANASQVNARLLTSGGKSKASLLLYGAWSLRDTRSVACGAVNSETSREDAEEDVDLIRWAAASLKTLWHVRFQAIAALILATLAAFAIVFVSRKTEVRLDTAFTVVTSDVSTEYSSDQLSAMTYEDAVELMKSSAKRYDATNLFNGNALYPTARSIDYDLMMNTLPSLWRLESTADLIADNLGATAISESVSVAANRDGRSYTLTVVGNDLERLEAVTAAFFAVAPDLSGHTAGGLTFITDDSVEVTAGVSLKLMLVLAWLLVLMAVAVYVLIAGYFDRRLYMRYEAEELMGCKIIGALPLSASSNDLSEVDTGLARYMLEWAEAHTRGGVLMITSALREEGCDGLTATAKTVFELLGKKVAVLEKAELASLERVKSANDCVLLNCPALAVDRDAAMAAVHADSILWAVRKGYADSRRIASAVKRIDSAEKIAGCVIVKK